MPKPTTIRYLDDASHSISYVDKDGNTITRNTFEPEYNEIVSRLSAINNANVQNNINRRNYEDSVRNAQQSIDIGRADLAPHVLPVPVCEWWPDDYTLPGSVVAWEPPLLLLKPAPAPAPVKAPSTPAEPHPAVMSTLEKILALLLSHSEALSNVGFKVADTVHDAKEEKKSRHK